MSFKQNIKGWLSLLRLPNLFTIPGDVILGFLIAEFFLGKNDFLLGYIISKGKFANFSIFFAIAAVLCVYILGLVTNDIVDFEEDSRERPHRPLPSGSVPKKRAIYFAILLFLGGVIFASFANIKVFIMVLILCGLVFGYNFLFKKNHFFGPFILALCRAGSVICGYFAASLSIPNPTMLFVIICIWFLFFFGVSRIAFNETRTEKEGIKGLYILLLIPALWLITVPIGSGTLWVLNWAPEIPPGIFLGIGSFVIFSFLMLKIFIILNLKAVNPEKVQKSVGDLIRSILFLQASGSAFLGYPYVALVIFLVWIPAQILSRKFYGS